jgi:hypothetical protein
MVEIKVGKPAIKVGDPVILTDASGFEDSGLENGCKGWANSVTTIPGEGTFVFFMPEDSKGMFVTFADRVEYDEEREGLELNAETIHKG